MLMIRLRRQGAKARPFYRVVVIDKRAARDGRALEVVGHYDPALQPEVLRANLGRIEHWVSKGAQLSDTVRTLLARHPEAGLPAGSPESIEAAASSPAAKAAAAQAQQAQAQQEATETQATAEAPAVAADADAGEAVAPGDADEPKDES
jgi:small subunit ribosomal protein S16